MLPTFARRFGPAVSLATVFFLLPTLLFLPVLYYSLTTPFSLVDDYHSWQNIAIFDDAEQLLRYFRVSFLDLETTSFLTGSNRYRPFWDFYNAVVWQAFGPTAWLHHLVRWLFHFGAIVAFAAAFSRFASSYREKPDGAATARLHSGYRWFSCLPLALLVYVGLFFPNAPAAQLSPPEVYSVFFLGLCNWMAALLLTGENRDAGGRNWLESTRLQYALFCLGYLGLAMSKEVNIAAALWLLIAWYALTLLRYGITRKGLLSGLPLLLIFGLTLFRLYTAARSRGFDRVSATGEEFLRNAQEIYAGLFQVETSGLITAGFILLTGVMLTAIVVKFLRRRIDNELLFILFLLGQLASISILASQDIAIHLRYWYILIPVFATLLAFGAKYLLAAVDERYRVLTWAAALVLTGFVLFFTAANYYNFLYQTLVKHSSAQVDAALIAELNALQDNGEYAAFDPLNPAAEESHNLRHYYGEFHRRFYGRNYRLPERPPSAGGQWYSVKMGGPPGLLPTHLALKGREDYAILSYARRLAARLQGEPPALSLDSIAAHLGEYRWTIYRLPADMESAIDRLTAGADEPARRGLFDLYHRDNRLAYVKKPCQRADIAARFFLHLFPVDPSDLAPRNGRVAFDNRDFYFQEYGVRHDGVCLAEVELPDYPILAIETGQYIPGRGRIWESRID